MNNNIQEKDMFSVVLATLWKSPRIHKVLEDLSNEPLVGEIILIDNAPGTPFTLHEKIRWLKQKENLYNQPSINLGVQEARYENLCIAQDDNNFDTGIFSLVAKHLDDETRMIGVDWHSIKAPGYPYEHNPSLPTQIIDTENITPGWFCLFFLKRHKYVPIPDDLKVAHGDNYLIRHMEGGLKSIINWTMEGEVSTTCNLPEFANRSYVDTAIFMEKYN